MSKFFGLLLVFTFCYLTVTSQSRISILGNQFVNEQNETIFFRGLNTSDPDKLERQGSWTFDYFQEMKNWGANVARIPVHPAAWRNRGEEAYLKLLDDGIAWAKQLGMYIIIDWHSIGNLKTEKYQSDIYYTTKDETYAFWEKIAISYGNNPTVAFYELFNEPTTLNGTLGEITWEEWIEINKELITIIRNKHGEGIPLVAGFNWAYDLTPVKTKPLEIEGIAYVSHPYPQKREKPWQEQWENDWGFVKQNYPLILTEIGFCDEDDPGAHIPVISDESYGDAITNYCDEKEISYLIWVFDKEWAPRLFTDENYTPSRHGKYFKKKLKSYKY